MTDATRQARFRFWFWLIHVIGVLVPRRLRADWRQEWEAELRYRETLLAEWHLLDWRNRFDLVRRSFGAFWDALALQPQRLEDEMFQDIRFGVRRLWKNPGFTLIAVVTLALGIGANAAIFSVVNAVLLRSLPFKEPERLLTVSERNLKKPDAEKSVVNGANFNDWRQQSQSFASLAAYMNWNYNLTGNGEPQRLRAVLVSGEFFRTLGVEAALGRAIAPDDDQEGSDNVVVLSHAFWQSHFGARNEVIGQEILLNNNRHTVVGVMPVGFEFPDARTEIWRPMAISPEQMQNRQGKWLRVIGRLQSGVTATQADAEMQMIAGRLSVAYPASN